MNWENELKGMELFIKKTNEYIKSKETVPMSVIEDIKSEIENIGILSSVDIKTGETLYEGLCRYSDVIEIIDRHISGKENTDENGN